MTYQYWKLIHVTPVHIVAGVFAVVVLIAWWKR